MSLSNGQILQSRYRILRLLGQGGMGAVYLAEDLRLGNRCALKEQVPDPNASPQALYQARQQFQTEARLLARLSHPNLPKVSDYFSDGVNEYLVMEYVEGENLADLLARYGGPLPEQLVLSWADQVLDALAYLHGQHPHPVIHRDIKPANLILTPQGRVKLVDFGLVKLLDASNPATATVMKGMGTPEYAPLEQYSSGVGHTDARSDIYSLGSTIYHLLTNVSPPDATQRVLNPSKLLRPRQINPGISAGTEAAILKAMEIRPEQRYQTVRELQQALRQTQILTGSLPVPPGSSRLRWGILAAVGGLLLFVCAAANFLLPLVRSPAGAAPTSTIAFIPSQTSTATTTSPVTSSPTPTHTPAPTHTPTPTHTPAPTHTPTPTRTPTPTHTPTLTRTPMPTDTPAPTFTQPPPSPVIPSPAQAVRDYYTAINSRQYGITWPTLSLNFRLKFNCCTSDGQPDFGGYRTWWDSVARVEIGQVTTITQDSNSATVYAELRYRMKDGRTAMDNRPYIKLRLDTEKDKWLFDDKGANP